LLKAAARSSALKKSTPKVDTGNAVDLPLPEAGDNKHPGRHLSAEVAIRAFPHVDWQILADPPAGFVRDPEPLHLLGGDLNPLGRASQMRICLRLRSLCCIG